MRRMRYAVFAAVPLVLALTGLVLAGCTQEETTTPTEEETASAPVTEDTATAETSTPPQAAPSDETPEAPVEAEVDEADINHALTMTREVSAYEPGGAVEVTVTLDYDGEEPVTALAVEETLPPDWRFGIVSEGEQPAISPETGATETFALVWINIPEWPMTVHYLIDAPNDAEGEYTLTGQAVYRQLAGELRTPMLSTPLVPAE